MRLLRHVRVDEMSFLPALALALVGTGFLFLGRAIRAVDDAIVELSPNRLS